MCMLDKYKETLRVGTSSKAKKKLTNRHFSLGFTVNQMRNSPIYDFVGENVKCGSLKTKSRRVFC